MVNPAHTLIVRLVRGHSKSEQINTGDLCDFSITSLEMSGGAEPQEGKSAITKMVVNISLQKVMSQQPTPAN